jgi:ABC-type antimicrobial peptide transport system permease subunit
VTVWTPQIGYNFNPIVVVLTVISLLLVGLLVSIVPALRAASVDPVRALQAE